MGAASLVFFKGAVFDFALTLPCPRLFHAQPFAAPGVRQRPCALTQRSDGTQAVAVVVARGARPQHSRGLVDVQPLRVPGDDATTRVRLFHEIVSVIGVDAGAGTGRFLRNATKRIIGE
jgi:hypothetical protein